MLVDKAISGLREILEKEVAGNHQIIITRLIGMDKAIDLVRDNATKTHDTLQAQIDQRPTEIDARIMHLQHLFDERFRIVAVEFDGVAKQFAERDTRSEREARDNKTAIDAALLAQKDAVRLQTEASALATAKSEAATMKQTDQLVTQLGTSTKALDDKITALRDGLSALLQAETRALAVQINDLKNWKSAMEGLGVGRSSEATDRRAGSADMRGSYSLAISAGLAAIGVISFILALNR